MKLLLKTIGKNRERERVGKENINLFFHMIKFLLSSSIKGKVN